MRKAFLLAAALVLVSGLGSAAVSTQPDKVQLDTWNTDTVQERGWTKQNHSVGSDNLSKIWNETQQYVLQYNETSGGNSTVWNTTLDKSKAIAAADDWVHENWNRTAGNMYVFRNTPRVVDTDTDRNGNILRATVNGTLGRNQLTELLIEYDACKTLNTCNETKYVDKYNNQWYWKGGDMANTSQLDELVNDAADIPYAVRSGIVVDYTIDAGSLLDSNISYSFTFDTTASGAEVAFGSHTSVFTVSASNDWGSGTFANTTETSGVLQMTRGRQTDSFKDGNVDGWNALGNEVSNGEGSVSANTSTGKDDSNSLYVTTNGDNDNNFAKAKYTGINLTGHYPVNVSTWYRHGSISESNTGGFRMRNSTSFVADIWFSGGGVEFRCDSCSWTSDGTVSDNTWYYLVMQVESNGNIKFWARDANGNDIKSPTTKDAGTGGTMDSINQIRITTRDNGNVHDDAHGDIAFTGFAEYTAGRYTSSLINNTEQASWDKIYVNASKIPSNTDLDLTFRTKDNSTGAVQERQVIDITEGAKNYTLNVAKEVDADFRINGTTPNGSTTWKIGDVKTYYSFNAAPTIHNITTYRSYQQTAAKSHCGRNDVNKSSGSTNIDFTVPAAADGSANHTVYIRHIKNSNTMDVLVNGNSVGTTSSTTGSGCNSNNWKVSSFHVDKAYVSGSAANDVTISPSGTDDNYVSMVALVENQNTTLYRDGWNYLSVVNVSEPDGEALGKLTANGNSILSDNNFTGSNQWLYTASVPSGSTTHDVQFVANDSSKLQQTRTQTLTVDYQNPFASFFQFADRNLVIDFNQTGESTTVQANASDPENNLGTKRCWFNGVEQGVTAESGTGYNCTVSPSTSGNHTVAWNSTDTLGHTNSTNQIINVTTVTLNTADSTPVNSLTSGNGTENSLVYQKIQFQIWHNLTVNGTANDTARISDKLETTNLHNYSLSNNLSSSRSGQQIDYNFTTNVTENDTYHERSFQITFWSENFTEAWQNDGSNADKRYHRLNATPSYNYTLQADVTFVAQSDYDPDNRHMELYECSSPSGSSRYSCDGNWNKVADTSNSGTNGYDWDSDGQHEALDYTVSFSDKLFYSEVKDGAEDSSSSSSGGTTGGAAGGAAAATGGAAKDQAAAVQEFLTTPRFFVTLFGIEFGVNVGMIFILLFGLFAVTNADKIGVEE